MKISNRSVKYFEEILLTDSKTSVSRKMRSKFREPVTLSFKNVTNTLILVSPKLFDGTTSKFREYFEIYSVYKYVHISKKTVF